MPPVITLIGKVNGYVAVFVAEPLSA